MTALIKKQIPAVYITRHLLLSLTVSCTVSLVQLTVQCCIQTVLWLSVCITVWNI